MATDQGLGYLAKDFFDHGLIQKVLIHHHSSRVNHYDWYPESARVNEEQLLECDVLLLFETGFNWELVRKAKAKGIKIVLMPMYECTPDPLPVEPDLIIAPSLLDSEYYSQKNSMFLPVPVNVPFKLRTKASSFVHNAGNGGIGGRNGTKEVLEAMKHIKSDITLILRSQVPLKIPNDPRIRLEVGQIDKNELFSVGDVFLFPEKFNGLSLPLQEAFASGMAVMAGDRFPVNTWLPKEILIPVDHYTSEAITRRKFACAQYTPEAIATTMLAWYNSDITKLSTKGKEFAEANSWEKLKPKYQNALSS